MGDENRGSAQSSRRRAPAAHSQIFPYLLVWAAVGTGVPLVLLLLDRVAGPTINSFPLGLLFVAWPTAFMMWMVSPDWFGVGAAATSVAANGLIYVGIGWFLRSLRHRTIGG